MASVTEPEAVCHFNQSINKSDFSYKQCNTNKVININKRDKTIKQELRKKHWRLEIKDNDRVIKINKNLK